MFQGELGLQFTLQVGSHYTTGELVELADLAARRCFHQIWLSDALRYRDPLVVATAVAGKVPIKLGTAILVPYFRNPIGVADSLLALSELTGERGTSPYPCETRKHGGKVLAGPGCAPRGRRLWSNGAQ